MTGRAIPLLVVTLVLATLATPPDSLVGQEADPRSEPLPSTAPPQEQPVLRELVAAVSPDRIEADIRKLVSFGTRHTLSDTLSETRGIGAARRWIRAEFDRISEACGGCLEVSYVSGRWSPGRARIPDEDGDRQRDRHPARSPRSGTLRDDVRRHRLAASPTRSTHVGRLRAPTTTRPAWPASSRRPVCCHPPVLGIDCVRGPLGRGAGSVRGPAPGATARRQRLADRRRS